MQKTRHPTRTSTPTQFSATFEKPSLWHDLHHEVHDSYSEEKHNALKCNLLSIPHKVMISLLLPNADNSTSNENINTNTVFSYF